MSKDYLAALEREKAGLKARKLTDRVKEVDAEIARVKKAMSAEAAPETPEQGDLVETPEG